MKTKASVPTAAMLPIPVHDMWTKKSTHLEGDEQRDMKRSRR